MKLPLLFPPESTFAGVTFLMFFYPCRVTATPLKVIDEIYWYQIFKCPVEYIYIYIYMETLEYIFIVRSLRIKFRTWTICYEQGILMMKQKTHKYWLTSQYVMQLISYRGSRASSSSKTRTYLFCIVNIMGTGVLETQPARASATMTFAMLNRMKSVPAR